MARFPGLSRADLAAALQRDAISKVRQSGSHIVVRRDQAGCVVPNYKELKLGTVGITGLAKG